MKIEEAKNSIGRMVMSYDYGYKLVKPTRDGPSHGPYLLKQVTKGGMAIINKRGEDFQVPPSLLDLVT